MLNSGAYAYTSTKVLGNAHLMVTGPYEIPNAQVDSFAITTNNVPGGAFRGFGGPQGAFAAETQMNRLAEALGLDPIALRLRNVLHEGSLTTTQGIIPRGVSIEEVVKECVAEAGWPEPSCGGWAGVRQPALAGDPSGCAAARAGLRLRAEERRLLLWRAGAVRGDHRTARPCRN